MLLQEKLLFIYALKDEQRGHGPPPCSRPVELCLQSLINATAAALTLIDTLSDGCTRSRWLSDDAVRHRN